MKNQIIFKTVFIILGILLWSLAGCTLTKQQRQSNRISKKIERMKFKHPEAFKDATTEVVRIDTVIKENEIQREAEITVDSAAIDSLVILLKQALLYMEDSGYNVSEILTEIITDHAKELIIIDSIKVDTLGIQLSVWYNKDKSILEFNIRRDSIHIEKEKAIETITITKTAVVRAVWYRSPWFWLLVGTIILFTVYKIRTPRL